jgi:predicted secreted hydrolase
MIRIIILSFLFSSVSFAQQFESASPQYKLQFPKDHGSHNNFQTEWWYITGQLVDKGQDLFLVPTKYGFQITFFRRASITANSKVKHEYLAHAAISDIQNKKFIYSSRANSELLAGASKDKLAVWNQDWSLESFSEDIVSIINLDLKQKTGLRLIFSPSQDPLKHGQNGYSKKGSCQDCASMYYSLPRLKVSGNLSIEGKEREVQGLAWYDHEFFSNILEEDQTGWDWFNLMFKDGRNLMAFAVRSKKDSRSFVSGTLQDKDSVKILNKDDIQWKVLKRSIMPSGTSYPTAWKVLSESLGLNQTVNALIENQEFQVEPISYWEGAIRTENALGYFEMTGYDKSIKLGL